MNKEAFLAGYLNKEAIVGGAGLPADAFSNRAPVPSESPEKRLERQRKAYMKDPRFKGKTTFDPKEYSGTRIGWNMFTDPAEAYKQQRQRAAHTLRSNLQAEYGPERGTKYFDKLRGTKGFMDKAIVDYHKYKKDPELYKKSITNRATPIIAKDVFMDSPYAKPIIGGVGALAAGYLGTNLLQNMSANRRHKEMMSELRKNRSATRAPSSGVFRLSTPAARARQGRG